MRKNTAKRERTVAIVVAEGFSLFEFAIAQEVFGTDYSALVTDWYRFVVCTATPSPIRSSSGLTIGIAAGLSVLRTSDTIVIPPMNDGVPQELLAALVAANRRGARIASLCTGAFVLAEAGLLDGRNVTTHWRSAGRLAARASTSHVDPNVLYIDEGNVLTSAGAAAAIDLCLHIVRSDYGAAVANRIARDMVVPPHRDGGQAQYVDPVRPDGPSPDLFSDTLSWVHAHLDEPITIEDLARRAAMSTRTFARRFLVVTGTTPHKWLTHQRVLSAQQLLETTDLGIDDIARRTGFGTATNLRQHFKSVVLASPGAYRRTFKPLTA